MLEQGAVVHEDVQKEISKHEKYELLSVSVEPLSFGLRSIGLSGFFY
tara:strand:- start:1906 stop:2046 length:141 start_codon:yes stop_codon:yes gene_type:complete